MTEEEKKNEAETQDEPTPINVDTLLDKQQKEVRSRFTTTKKKYLDTNVSWGMFIIIALAIFGIGYALTKSVSLGAGYSILAVCCSLLAAVVFYGLGKIAFAYITGYEVCHIEFFGFVFVKDEKGKYKARFNIVNFFELHVFYKPREGEDDPKPSMLMLGGIVGFVICIALELGLSFLPSIKGYDLQKVLLYAAAFGSLIFVYEIFPGKYDTPNDMYLTIITKKKEDRDAYNHYLIDEYNDLAGNKPEPVKYDSYDDSRTKPLTLLAILHTQVSQGMYQEALQTIDTLAKYDVVLTDSIKIEALHEKLYLYLTHGRTREAEKMIISLDKMEKNSSDYHPSSSSLRDEVIIAGLLDNSLDELKSALGNFTKLAKSNKESERILNDIKLINSAFYHIRQVHPDWKFENISLESIAKEDKPEEDDKNEY